MTLNGHYIGANNYQNSVNSDRKMLEYLVGLGVSGVTTGSFAVTPVAGQHQASVGAANSRAFLHGRNTPSSQGTYHAWADAPEIVNLPVPQANPFIATLVLRMADPQYGTVVGAVGPRIDVVSGTPASSPIPVTDAAIDALGVPGGWTRIADIRINTADTGAVPIGQFVDTRLQLPDRAGDPFVCVSTNRPPGVLNRTIFETDTKATGFYNGTTWRMTDSEWQAYTPTITNFAVGTLPAGVPLLRFEYKRTGDECTVRFHIQFGNNGSAPNNPTFTMPFPIAAGFVRHNYENHGYGSIWDDSAGFETVLIPALLVGANFCQLFFLASQTPPAAVSVVGVTSTLPFAWAVGDSINGVISYKMA